MASPGALARDFTFGYIDNETGARVGAFPKQELAHACPADITFFGGQAGPGKSEMLVVEAVTACLQYENAQAALFRRKHTELKRSLIPRFRKLVPKSIARYNATDHCAEFFNGSILWFCHCQHEFSVYDYQSSEWIMLGLDESTHFTQFQIDYLVTRVRSPRPGLHRRIVLGSNPGNVGHGMHKRRFVKPPSSSVQEILYRYNQATGVWEPGNFGKQVQPLDVWRPWPEPNDPTPPTQVLTRCFVNARLEDNPAMLKAQPNYKAQLYALGGDKAKQLADGDWDANESMVVGADWKETHQIVETDRQLIDVFGLKPGQIIRWHVVDRPKWRPAPGSNIFGSVDYGYGAPWSFHLHAVLPGGHTRTFFERYMARKRDVEQARMIREDIEQLMKSPDEGGCSMSKPDWIVMDPSMWNSREEMGIAKSIAEVYDDELARPLRLILRKGAGGRSARVSRPQRWKDALSIAPDGRPWWSVTTGCPELIRTVPEVPWDEEDKEVEDDESENHAYEDTGRFFEARPHAPVLPPPDPYEHLDRMSAQHQRELDKEFEPKRRGGSFNPRAFNG